MTAFPIPVPILMGRCNLRLFRTARAIVEASSTHSELRRQTWLVAEANLLLPYDAEWDEAQIALRPRLSDYLGKTTESMTWITPLEASTSVLMTWAPFTFTVPWSTVMSSGWPLTVGACMGLTSAAMTFPGTTW